MEVGQTMEIKPREGATTNPYNANGTTGDPREQKCWDLYIIGITNGRENAYQAALDAGYSLDHSRNITLQGWFKERLSKLKRKDMLSKAEKVLQEMLEMDDTQLKITEKGNVSFRDASLTRIKQDTAKFLAERLGKAEYSTRTEHTGKDGEAIAIQAETKEKINKAIDNL